MKKLLFDASAMLWKSLYAGRDDEFGREVAHPSKEGKTVYVNSAQFGLENFVNLTDDDTVLYANRYYTCDCGKTRAYIRINSYGNCMYIRCLNCGSPVRLAGEKTMKLLDEIEADKAPFVEEVREYFEYWPRLKSALLAADALAQAVKSEGPLREARIQAAMKKWEEH